MLVLYEPLVLLCTEWGFYIWFGFRRMTVKLKHHVLHESIQTHTELLKGLNLTFWLRERTILETVNGALHHNVQTHASKHTLLLTKSSQRLFELILIDEAGVVPIVGPEDVLPVCDVLPHAGKLIEVHAAFIFSVEHGWGREGEGGRG